MASGRVHAALSGQGGGSAVADFLRRFYLVLIPLMVLGMLVHNALDWLRKATGRLPPLREDEGVLLSISERLQHGVLILSFGLLAYSGFVLKFADAWWAVPLRVFGEEGRRLFHRGAAATFAALAIWHLAYLIFTARGRERLRALWPHLRDFRDAFHLTLFNMRLAPSRPRLERFSYIEKAEYWALMWGSAVMVATGVILVFHNFALSQFPLWVIETARIVHYLEAVLACLAILVWHLYWTVYDPEVYPMNWSWLTGRARGGKEGGG